MNQGNNNSKPTSGIQNIQGPSFGQGQNGGRTTANYPAGASANGNNSMGNSTRMDPIAMERATANKTSSNPQNSTNIGARISPNGDANNKGRDPQNWVREQEIQALKVQNRHLISKLEELENSKTDIEENNKLILNFRGQLDKQLSGALNLLQQQVQKFTHAVLTNTESALKTGFESIQGTLKALYAQNQRGQEQIDRALKTTTAMEQKIENHSVEMLSQAKVQNLQFQDRLVGNIQNFCDRIERVIDMRLSSLSSLDSLKGKQEEAIKSLTALEQNRNELIGKVMAMEVTQKNSDSIHRETQNQVQALRHEIRGIREEVEKLLAEAGKIGEIAKKNSITVEKTNNATESLQKIQQNKADAIREKNEIESYLKRINEQLNPLQTKE